MKRSFGRVALSALALSLVIGCGKSPNRPFSWEPVPNDLPSSYVKAAKDLAGRAYPDIRGWEFVQTVRRKLNLLNVETETPETIFGWKSPDRKRMVNLAGLEFPLTTDSQPAKLEQVLSTPASSSSFPAIPLSHEITGTSALTPALILLHGDAKVAKQVYSRIYSSDEPKPEGRLWLELAQSQIFRATYSFLYEEPEVALVYAKHARFMEMFVTDNLKSDPRLEGFEPGALDTRTPIEKIPLSRLVSDLERRIREGKRPPFTISPDKSKEEQIEEWFRSFEDFTKGYSKAEQDAFMTFAKAHRDELLPLMLQRMLTDTRLSRSPMLAEKPPLGNALQSVSSSMYELIVSAFPTLFPYRKLAIDPKENKEALELMRSGMGKNSAEQLLLLLEKRPFDPSSWRTVLNLLPGRYRWNSAYVAGQPFNAEEAYYSSFQSLTPVQNKEFATRLRSFIERCLGPESRENKPQVVGAYARYLARFEGADSLEYLRSVYRKLQSREDWDSETIRAVEICHFNQLFYVLGDREAIREYATWIPKTVRKDGYFAREQYALTEFRENPIIKEASANFVARFERLALDQSEMQPSRWFHHLVRLSDGADIPGVRELLVKYVREENSVLYRELVNYRGSESNLRNQLGVDSRDLFANFILSILDASDEEVPLSYEGRMAARKEAIQAIKNYVITEDRKSVFRPDYMPSKITP